MVNKKLTSEQAQAIIHRVAAGEPQKNLALEHGVSPGTISNLISGKNWPDLERPEPPAVVVRGRKLMPTDIPVILQRLAQREKPGDIAPDYGVTRQAIADIASGKRWGHIPRPEPVRPVRRPVWER